jgi:hypothetical protein
MGNISIEVRFVDFLGWVCFLPSDDIKRHDTF